LALATVLQPASWPVPTPTGCGSRHRGPTCRRLNLEKWAVSCGVPGQAALGMPQAVTAMCSSTFFRMASQPAMWRPRAVSRMALVESWGVGPGAVPVAQDGLGSRDGVHPEVLAIRKRSPRATHRCRPRPAGTAPPTWNSHCPIITSALVPSMPMPASMQAAVLELDDLTAGHLVAAHCRSSTGPEERDSPGRASRAPPVLEERVLLLDAEHRLLVAVLLDHLAQVGAGVGRMGGEVGQPTSHITSLSLGATERVRERRTRAAGRSPSRDRAPGWCSSRRTPRCRARSRRAITLVLLRRSGEGSVPVDPDVFR